MIVYSSWAINCFHFTQNDKIFFSLSHRDGGVNNNQLYMIKLVNVRGWARVKSVRSKSLLVAPLDIVLF